MAGNLQPLDEKFPIVDQFGKPTLYFIKWCQQRQIDITEALTLLGLEEYLAARPLQQGNGIQITPASGNIAEGPLLIDADVQEILDQISTTRGTIIYRNASDWVGLAPGTAGDFLQTAGAGADPLWAAAGGGGSDYRFIKAYTGLANAADTINVNNTAYVDIGSMSFNVDLDEFLFTDFRLVFSAGSNQAGQTITAQMTTIFTPGTPIHTGGNDVVINNTFGVKDSGWKSRDAGASSGLGSYGIALKGSNGTVDLAINSLVVMFR